MAVAVAGALAPQALEHLQLVITVLFFATFVIHLLIRSMTTVRRLSASTAAAGSRFCASGRVELRRVGICSCLHLFGNTGTTASLSDVSHINER